MFQTTQQTVIEKMTIVPNLVSRSSGRWPPDHNIPSAEQIRKILKDVTLLISVPIDDEGEENRLHAILTDKIDIYRTDITNLADASWEPGDVKSLRVRFAWQGRVPIGQRWAGDDIITVEDIFANIGVEDLKPGTLVGVCTRFVKIDNDETLGGIWRPTFLIYDRES